MTTLINRTTPNYSIPVPSISNRIVDDIPRLINALYTIDGLLFAKQDKNSSTSTSNILDSNGILRLSKLPAFQGDVTSTAGTSTLILSNTGVVPGAYNKVTVDAKGRVTAGSNEAVPLKTINGTSLYGEGNILVSGGGGGSAGGNLDGGGPFSNYGGLSAVDGGSI
jgi:hypothetical protein